MIQLWFEINVEHSKNNEYLKRNASNLYLIQGMRLLKYEIVEFNEKAKFA